MCPFPSVSETVARLNFHSYSFLKAKVMTIAPLLLSQNRRDNRNTAFRSWRNRTAHRFYYTTLLYPDGSRWVYPPAHSSLSPQRRECQVPMDALISMAMDWMGAIKCPLPSSCESMKLTAKSSRCEAWDQIFWQKHLRRSDLNFGCYAHANS